MPGPSVQQSVPLYGVGTPVGRACVCSHLWSRLLSFFQTDTLPPSAQTNSESLPAAGQELQREPRASVGASSFLSPFLYPTTTTTAEHVGTSRGRKGHR